MKTPFGPLVPAGLLLAFLAPSACSAQSPLGFTLDTPTITAGASPTDQVITFSGTLTNTSAAALYLNGDQLTIDPPLSGDDTEFFNTFVFPADSNGNALPQPTLGVGQSLDIALFDVTVPAGTGLGTYNGSFQIQGGATDSDCDLLAPAQTFSVTTSPNPVPPVSPMPVPEIPGSLTLSLGILLTAGLLAARRKKAALPAQA
ncbi:MAG: hypothetical protein ACRYFS_08205 [Janthinobacterium lividum]